MKYRLKIILTLSLLLNICSCGDTKEDSLNSKNKALSSPEFLIFIKNIGEFTGKSEFLSFEPSSFHSDQSSFTFSGSKGDDSIFISLTAEAPILKEDIIVSSPIENRDLGKRPHIQAIFSGEQWLSSSGVVKINKFIGDSIEGSFNVKLIKEKNINEVKYIEGNFSGKWNFICSKLTVEFKKNPEEFSEGGIVWESDNALSSDHCQQLHSNIFLSK